MPLPRHADYLSRRYFGSLNGLRFLSIAAVLWHHAPTRELLQGLSVLTTRGFLGVDLFFVLSGYLITHLLLQEERRKGRFSLADFYWRRVLRIVPVYYFVLTAVCSYYVLLKGDAELAAMVPFYYLFLSNFLEGDIPTLAVTWSLSVEEQFYVAWPLALLLLPRRLALPVLGLAIAFNVLVSAPTFAAIGQATLAVGPLRLALISAPYAAILIGSGLAVLLQRRRVFEALAGPLGHRLSAPAALAVLIALLLVLPVDLSGWPRLLVHLSMAILLATLVLREDNGLCPALSFGPVARIGEVSYGIYLYHLIALHVANRAIPALGLPDAGGWWVTFVYPVLAIVIAEISFRTLEAYFRQFRDRRPGRIAAA